MKLDKGAPFTGRAALETVKREGAKRQLVGFKATEKGSIPRHGYDVYLKGTKVDIVRSGSGGAKTSRSPITRTIRPFSRA